MQKSCFPKLHHYVGFSQIGSQMLCELFVTRWECRSAGRSSTNAGVTTSATSAGTTTVDPRGIPDWEKVGQLAEEFLSLTGIAVLMAEADR